MAFAFDEIFAYGGQLIVAAKKRVPKALGMGEEKIDHSAYIEGNTQIGKVDAFSSATATLMVGREDTKGTPMSLNVKGCQQIDGDSGAADGLKVTVYKKKCKSPTNKYFPNLYLFNKFLRLSGLYI